ncbi:amino acid adenylation domain-containing protein, partial [Plantactinospora solaniradicis]
ATQVISRIRAAFDVELPVAALFDAPSIAGLAAAVDATAPGAVAPPIVPVDRSLPLPLSFAQQRLWFLTQLEPDSIEYNTPVEIRLTGALDVDALRVALSALVARHEVLRTRLVAGADGTPYQVIDPPVPFTLPVVDLSAEADRAVAVRAWLEADRQIPFDLAAGPLFRATLIRIGPDEHVLAIAKHHVVSDEWSAGILRRELDTLYAAARDGVDPQGLPELLVQYADFAVWQRQWLTGEVLEGQLGYWRDLLADAPVLELPTDRPRPAQRSSDGEALDFVIPAVLVDGLRAVSRSAGVSMFMTLFGAFNVLLGRYSGQDDIVMGTPIANRNRAEVEGLIGFFVNTLVLRTDLSGDPTFTELLDRVRTGILEAFAHQDVPFEQLVDELGVVRDRSRSPLFQVLFNYVMEDVEEDGEENNTADETQHDDTIGHMVGGVDLRFIVGERAGGLVATVEYSTALFDRDRMVRLVGHFVALVSAIVADRDRRLSGLSVLTESERGVLRSWAAGGVSVSDADLVPGLIAGWVGAAPEAEAVRFGVEGLSYARVWERANRLAHYLRGVGVGPEVVVGVCLPRGLDFVTTVLAVWQAGGAYLPLDPGYPMERLAVMLADGGVSVLVGMEETVGDLPVGRVRTVVLDDPAAQALVGVQPATAPQIVLHPDQTAYVLFTSGSTGRPKGVQVTHRGLASLVAGQRELFGIGAGTGVLQFASFGFDASVWDMCLALAAGGRLVIADEADRGDPAALAALVRAGGVEVATLPPSLLGLLSPEDVAGLSTLVSAGERLDGGLARVWAASCRLVNAYGPTEVAVCASAGTVEVGARWPSIGAPFGASRLYVLDRALHEVPVGVAGELFVGGPGLARGYAGRADLTAERFVADPFNGDGSRLYRSGDVVRWLPDGRLEFVGRADDQVKVRGFRVEPGEVEQVLREHSGIGDVVVVADGTDADRRLIAYVVPADPAEGMPALDVLRGLARAALPEYMIPAAFVELTALPLNRSGKVDRAALPAPDGVRPTLAGGYVAPSGPTQELLAGIWAELLGVDQIGVHDNFFTLGGHSLLATQVVSRIRAVFAVEVPVAALFDGPTIAGLAEVIDAASPGVVAAPMVRVDRDGLLPLSFAQQRMWFLAQLEPGSVEYNMPMPIGFGGDLDVAALAVALGGLVARHEVLRTRLVADADGVPWQVVDPPASF